MRGESAIMEGGEQLTVDGRLDLLFGQLSLNGSIEKDTASTESNFTRSLISPEEPQPPSRGISSL